MRDLSVVKDTRSQLRNEMAIAVNKRTEFIGDSTFKELGEYDKQVFVFLTKAIDILRVQINTLEFVLNEDTNLNDAFWTRPANENGITKDSVFK